MKNKICALTSIALGCLSFSVFAQTAEQAKVVNHVPSQVLAALVTACEKGTIVELNGVYANVNSGGDAAAAGWVRDGAQSLAYTSCGTNLSGGAGGALMNPSGASLKVQAKSMKTDATLDKSAEKALVDNLANNKGDFDAAFGAVNTPTTTPAQ